MVCSIRAIITNLKNIDDGIFKGRYAVKVDETLLINGLEGDVRRIIRRVNEKEIMP